MSCTTISHGIVCTDIGGYESSALNAAREVVAKYPEARATAEDFWRMHGALGNLGGQRVSGTKIKTILRRAEADLISAFDCAAIVQTVGERLDRQAQR